jgi:hypothetical protein
VRLNRAAAQVFAPDIPAKNRPHWLTIALIPQPFPPVVIPGRALAARTRNLEIPGSMLRIAPE